MYQKCLTSLLVVSICATCSGWSQEEKFDPNSRSATTVIEERISVRDSDQVKATGTPLQVRVNEEPESEDIGQKKSRTDTAQPVDTKDMLQLIYFFLQIIQCVLPLVRQMIILNKGSKKQVKNSPHQIFS